MPPDQALWFRRKANSSAEQQINHFCLAAAYGTDLSTVRPYQTLTISRLTMPRQPRIEQWQKNVMLIHENVESRTLPFGVKDQKYHETGNIFIMFNVSSRNSSKHDSLLFVHLYDFQNPLDVQKFYDSTSQYPNIREIIMGVFMEKQNYIISQKPPRCMILSCVGLVFTYQGELTEIRSSSPIDIAPPTYRAIPPLMERLVPRSPSRIEDIMDIYRENFNDSDDYLERMDF